VTFNAPAGAQPPITDYHLELTGAGFRQGAVTVGALQNNGSWIIAVQISELTGRLRAESVGQ
jgi:hypothetical protein